MAKTHTLKLGGGIKNTSVKLYGPPPLSLSLSPPSPHSLYLLLFSPPSANFTGLEYPPPPPPAEPILPGLALPEAFESLDKRIESTVQFCHLKGSVESQILGLVTVCQEMQRLLKFAFIGKIKSSPSSLPPLLYLTACNVARRTK